MEEYNKALVLAMKAHKKQKRKVSGDPYVVHPIRVATKILYETKNYQLAICGLLHDVIEDSDYTYEDIKEMFGEGVANVVMEVTDDLELKTKLSKVNYWVSKWDSMSNSAKVIKFYDRLDNIKDRPTVPYLEKTLKALSRINTSTLSAYPWTAYSELKRECEALLKEMS